MTTQAKEKKEFTVEGYRIIIERDSAQLFHIIIVMPDLVGKRFWLQEAWKYNICPSLARYLHDKHVKGEENSYWLKKAEKKPEKHEPHTLKGFQDWLRQHQWEVVGQFGTYDTPVYRYLQETRNSWKKGSFLVDGLYQNKPRWMDRLDHFCQELYRDDEVKGFWLLALMGAEQWNTPYYDLHPFMERMNNR